MTAYSTSVLEAIANKAGCRVRFKRSNHAAAGLVAATLATRDGRPRYLFATAAGFRVETDASLTCGRKHQVFTAEGWETRNG